MKELAANDNTRKRLKEFVCRLVRHIGSEINIKALCQNLLQPWMAMVNQTESLKVAWLTEITELVTVFLLYSTSALAMDESIMAFVSLPENYGSSCFKATNIMDISRKEKIEAVRKVCSDLAVFQLEAIAWCMDVVAVYAPNMNKDQFVTILKQFLFLGDFQSYFPMGEIFGEIECNSLQLLGFCTQASEEVLARVILLGITDVYPLTMGDALSIIESLVWRAAAFETLFKGLHAKSNQLPSAIIKLASFSLPGIPQQSLSHLVYKDKYWRACLVLLVVAVYNPVTVGLYVWEHNSTVRQMMQMVLTGSQKFFSLDDDTAGNLKVDDLASEATTSDAKAEELIYSHQLNREHTNRTASSEISLDSYEWRGNVTLLNTSGVVGRLPQSIIEELEEVDKVYQLGRVLRECRSPDYFAQITCLQTLSKSWGWLRRILCQEPELVSVLPFMWQCKLLYMQEGSVGSGGKNFVDSRKLYLAISKVIIDKSHEKEVTAFVEYFSPKLSDKNSLIRCQARCFFARMFNISFEFLNEVSPSGDSGQSYFSTLNTSFDCCILPRGDMPEETTRNSFPPYYDLGWLEQIGTHPNAHAILGSLVPAIQHAVLVETTFEVIIACLKFLEKYSPPFPSLLSFSCTIARLLVQRKELAACLLSMEKEDHLHTAYLSSSISGQDIYTPDFVLNSLYEALRVGTSCQSTDENIVGIESSLVTLVVPQTDGGDKVSFRRITLYKIVLDAVILVLSLSSSKENHRKNKNVIIENMKEFLLPNVAGKTSVAWVESMMGKSLPLLSEEEAIIFSQSKDERIAFAGCNALSINAILEVCEGLGIPVVTVDYILGVLNSTIGFRIEEYLNKSKGRNAWFLQSCLQTLSKFTNKCFPNLSWILSQLSSNNFLCMVPFIMHKPVVVPSSITINGNEEKYELTSTADIVDSTIGQIAISDVSFHLGLLRGVPDLISAYIELRKCIQREICCGNVLFLLQRMETCLIKFKVFEDHRLSWVHLSSFMLPSLAVIVSSTSSIWDSFKVFHITESHSKRKFLVECNEPLKRILIEMEAELARNLNYHNLLTEEIISSKVYYARFIMAELQLVFEKGCEKPHSLYLESLFKTMNVNYQESCTLLNASYICFLGVEGSLRTFLILNLKQAWCESWLKYKPVIFISELLQFMFTIIREGRELFKLTSNLEEDDTLGNRKCVMLSGCCGLFSGFLKFLDLYMNFNVWTSLLFSTENGSNVLPQGLAQSFMQLCFKNIVNESSWQFMIKILKSTLDCFGMSTPLSNLFKNQGKSRSLTLYPFVTYGLNKPPVARAILEFFYMCSFHPRTVLLCCPSAHLENQAPEEKIKMLPIQMLSPHCLVNITSQECSNIQMIGSLQCLFEGKCSIDEVINEDVVSVGTILLVHSSAESDNKLLAILENLLSLDCDDECDKMVEQASSVCDVLSNAAKGLLWTLYFAFPFSVSGALQFDRGHAIFSKRMCDGFKILQSRKLLFYRSKKALPMYGMVQNALKIICEGTEKQSDIAYGFCHPLAKNHPVLVLPHMATLAALLKEKMSEMTQGEDNVCSFGHALYLVAGLLDALRPHIFDLHNSECLNDVKCSRLKNSIAEYTIDVHEVQDLSKGSLKVITDVYFEFLNNLQTVNLPKYVKVVIPLADFLCHCVASGKHCLEIVTRRHKVIETIAQKFSKIKKLGFLLSLIDNPDVLLPSPRTDTELLKTQPNIEEFPSGPPLLPVDVILKVQNQLQHFLTLHTDNSDNYSSNYREPGVVLHQQKKSKNCDLEDENNLLSVLDDVEKASAHVPTLLASLESFLIELTKVQNKDAQNCIYQLLERLLLHCPSKNSCHKVVKAVLLNLKSSDISLAKMAAQQAVRFFYHCPELQETLLVELFLTRGDVEEDLKQLLCDLLFFTN
ncbi:uncharacterized protein LOC131045838 isoform X7 [Cryptomeria japonica]|uniref:uncharacterized protein LOC131045838 isoform X7 n=1 Tax=Cryptomeria japonica TaxID=3369 RepID=UPI0027DA75E2|nr:uncharacterized protein LOC131045838 isoform X7 [Cryptomeria japonica]